MLSISFYFLVKEYQKILKISMNFRRKLQTYLQPSRPAPQMVNFSHLFKTCCSNALILTFNNLSL